MNEYHTVFTNDKLYNPYNRDDIINSIGEQIEDGEHNSEYWNNLSDFMLRCEYKMQINVKSAKANELKVLSLNIRSLQKNIARLREEIDLYKKYDIISLNETNCISGKLPNGISDILLDGFYEPIVQDPIRKSGKGGGLAIYINKRVCSPENIENFVPNHNSETVNHTSAQCAQTLHKLKMVKFRSVLLSIYSIRKLSEFSRTIKIFGLSSLLFEICRFKV